MNHSLLSVAVLAALSLAANGPVHAGDEQPGTTTPVEADAPGAEPSPQTNSAATQLGAINVVQHTPRQGDRKAALAERRYSGAVTEVLGAESMSRRGDSSAADALKRVTGLTLVDGRYIYVRGLGERYASVLLNGARIPSPDPSRRVVPMDLFPTAVLESVVVRKSAGAELPGHFGGGAVLLVPGRFALWRVNPAAACANPADCGG